MGALVAGWVMGVLIVLAALYILYLRGANAVLLTQNKVLEGQQADSDGNLRNLAATVAGLKKPFDIHFTDEQLNRLAMLVNDRVVRLYEAKQAGALQKLN